MSYKNHFDNLVESLTAEEKADLISKIEESLQAPDDDSLVAINIPDKNIKKKRLLKQYQEIPWYRRLLFWVLGLLGKTSPLDKLYDDLIKELKNSLMKGGNKLIVLDVEKRSILPELPMQVYDIYYHAAPLFSIFRRMWEDSSFLDDFIYQELSTGGFFVKKSVEDFISPQELLDSFLNNEPKQTVYSHMFREYKTYIKSIPKIKYQEMERRLLPFYYTYFLLMFPFKSFFARFQWVIADGTPMGSVPEFKKAPADALFITLERLYHCFFISQKIGVNFRKNEDILKILIERENPSDSKEQLEDKLEKSLKKVQLFINSYKKASSKIDIVKILQFLKNDLYLDIVCHLPKLNMKNYYESILKARLSNQMKKYYKKGLESYTINKLIVLVGGQIESDLSFYQIDPAFPKGFPQFKHTRSAELVRAYRKNRFLTILAPLNNILVKNISRYVDSTAEGLTQSIGNINEIFHKIFNIDASLSPQSKEGKLFQDMKSQLTYEKKSIDTYINYIKHIDMETERLIQLFLSHIQKYMKLLEELLSAPQEQVRTFITNTTSGGKSYEQKTIGRVIEEQSEELLQLILHFKQLLQIENDRPYSVSSNKVLR